MDRRSPRRRLLRFSGGALVVGLAGCLGAVQDSNPFDATSEIDESSPIEDGENATVVETSSTGIRTEGAVIVPAGFDLSENISAGGSVVLERDADVEGTVEAGEHVLLEEDAEVDADVRAGGRVVLHRAVEVGGSIDAAGDVLVQTGTKVVGTIEAGGDVVLEGDATVDGDVTGRSVDVAVTAGVRGAVHETG